MKIAGLQLGMHWRFDDWPDEIHVSHALTPNVSRCFTDAAALDRACDFIAGYGSCPYDTFDLYEPWDESCYQKCSADIDRAECWRRFFMAEGH